MYRWTDDWMKMGGQMTKYRGVDTGMVAVFVTGG